MIVPTMTSEELAKEIISDFKHVTAKTKHLMKQTHKVAVRSKNKHHQQMFEYKSPLDNKWLIFINYHVKNPIFVPVIYYINRFGLNGIMVSQNEVKDQYFHIRGRTTIQQDMYHYTSHFLQRYNERFLQNNDMSKLDLLKHFIKQNQFIQARTAPDTEKYKNPIYGKFNDGIGFGDKEVLSTNNMLHFRTFLTTDKIYDNQDDYLKETSIESIGQFKDVWEEVYGERNVDAFSDKNE